MIYERKRKIEKDGFFPISKQEDCCRDLDQFNRNVLDLLF